MNPQNTKNKRCELVGRCAIIFTLLQPVQNLYAQNSPVKFKRLSLEQGLSQSAVNCILQDRQGFMWFGTGDGLNKYAGYSFTKYKHEAADSASISGNWIKSIYEDRAGTLWIGTDDGINKLDRGQGNFMALINALKNPQNSSQNKIWSVCKDRRGALWIGTENGLFRRRWDDLAWSQTPRHAVRGPDDARMPLLDEAVNLVYHGMRANDTSFNVTIEKEYDETIGKLEIVPQDISRVFLNIVNNACYAAQQKAKMNLDDFSPTLSVRTQNRGDQIEIRIRDNGNGIPRDIREKIFDPFFTTKPAGQGTGLGLSISYDIIAQQHSGEIKVETEEAKFTEFVVRLPRLG